MMEKEGRKETGNVVYVLHVFSKHHHQNLETKLQNLSDIVIFLVKYYK
jgi:hypothetical protein